MKARKTREFSKIYQNNCIYKNVANIIVYCIVCRVINKFIFLKNIIKATGNIKSAIFEPRFCNKKLRVAAFFRGCLKVQHRY